MTDEEGMNLFMPFAKLGVSIEEVTAACKCILRERGTDYKPTVMDIAAWLKEYCEWRAERAAIYQEIGDKINSLLNSK